ncbi:MAG: zinc ribbon domain-containing protein [Clostridia bacterium]|nr:zinc ribbon domain-containing protein [Clostridia bacterium]
MFCPKCGQEVHDEAIVCVHCGCSLKKSNIAEDDAPNTGFTVLGAFFPLVGFILYLVYHSSSPQKAKSAGKGALIGLIISVVLGCLWGGLVGTMMASLYY